MKKVKTKLFLLRCPKCRKNMKYQGRGLVRDKRKKCVYCNSSFKIRDHVLKELN